MEPVQRIAERQLVGSFFASLRRLPRAKFGPEVLAGLTLLAIAVPEQIATAQLAAVPSFLAMLAFIGATIVFATFGSNPILSIGADSTIAPLFAVALLKFAAPSSTNFLVLVSATAVTTGVLLAIVGALRFGWLADFLSVPIVAGFMTGIGLTIIAHQLPSALGLPGGSGGFVHRLGAVVTHLGDTRPWPLAIALVTLTIVVVGVRWNPRAPLALAAMAGATVLTVVAHLGSHGVATLGTLRILAPTWRLSSFDWSKAGVVATTSATVALVILSQSVVTSRASADEIGVAVDLNRDIWTIGLANIVTGVAGSMPVNASPARTEVVRLAGGRTQLVGLVAAAGALAVIPLAPGMRDVPLAALAGVLFYIAGRLVAVRSMREIARVDRYELALALVTGVAVIALGVQEGLGVAVALAILDRTRRSARPHTVVLGRRPGTTSWEQIGRNGTVAVSHVTVMLFSAPLYFANAAIFRAEIHSALRDYPQTKHVVIDAAPMTDIDFTGLGALSDVAQDLVRDHVTIALARANDSVVHALARAPQPVLRDIEIYGSVDEAVTTLLG